MQKKRRTQYSILLFFIMNIVLFMQLLPQTSAKYVERVVYDVKKHTKAEIKEYHFAYQGSEAEFVAPYSGYYAVQLWGADGRAGSMQNFVGFQDQQFGGKGGYIVAQVYLKHGERLEIRVGGTSIDGTATAGYNAGINGGGQASISSRNLLNVVVYAGGGGGGATDIRIDGERILVAGGGGGGGSRDIGSGHVGGNGGNAGEDTHADGMAGGASRGSIAGTGGTSIAGGEGWDAEARNTDLDGSLERGGSSDSIKEAGANGGGAGGGGGYYGGGASGSANAAGGGGSSMRLEPMEAISIIHSINLPEAPSSDDRGGRPTHDSYANHGYAIISYLDPVFVRPAQ